MGDYHVRFCERLGVRFPLSTRHSTRYKRALAHTIPQRGIAVAINYTLGAAGANMHLRYN